MSGQREKNRQTNSSSMMAVLMISTECLRRMESYEAALRRESKSRRNVKNMEYPRRVGSDQI